MKKIFFVLFLTANCYLLTASVFAETATPSASQELLDRVATKVATLAEKMKKATAGEITSVGSKSFFIGDTKINVSEVTTYYKIKAGNRTTIDFKNLVKGDDAAVIGTLDSATGEITARQVIVKIQRLTLSGKVTIIDAKKNIYTLDGKEAEIDSTTAVKTATAAAILKSKYSDIKVGDNLIIYGYYVKPSTPLTTLKALIIPQ